MTASGVTSQSIADIQNRKNAQLALWVYTVALVIFLAIAPGRIASLYFPGSSLLLGIYLYRTVPTFYVGFTWWMIFLAPMIRRIIDFRAGDFTFGPWTITALIVTAISGTKLIRDLPKLYKQVNLPFLTCTWSIFYGFLISFIQNEKNVVVIGLLSWFTPVAFGYYLYANWRNYLAYRQIIRRTFVLGIVVMGAYGVVQYLTPMPWDLFWIEKLIETGTLSFGVPEPLGIRISSTMSSPQAFASVVVAGLVMLFCEKPGALYFPATGFGYLSVLLSMARAAWVSWIVAIPMLLLSLRPKLQMRLSITLVITVLLVIPIATMEDFYEVIDSRIQSLSDKQDDVSLSGRLSGYNELLGIALSTLVGGGYGFSVPIETDLAIGDGSVLPMLFSFGWIGTLPYIAGLLLLMLQLFRSKSLYSEPLISGAKAITLGLLAQIGFNHMLIEAIGIAFWAFLGLGLAAAKFHEAGNRENFNLSTVNENIRFNNK
jgi:uncharacterized membrane protein